MLSSTVNYVNFNLVSTLWMTEAVCVQLVQLCGWLWRPPIIPNPTYPPGANLLGETLKLIIFSRSCRLHAKLMAFSIRKPVKNLHWITETSMKSFTCALLLGSIPVHWSAPHGYTKISFTHSTTPTEKRRYLIEWWVLCNVQWPHWTLIKGSWKKKEGW